MNQECSGVSRSVGGARLVEAGSFHITNLQYQGASVEAPALGRSGASRAPAREPSKPPVRLSLQRRAQSNLRRHFFRGLRRFVVLVVADLASFYVMRAV